MDDTRNMEMEDERDPLYSKRDKIVIAVIITVFMFGCLVTSVEDMIQLIMPSA